MPDTEPRLIAAALLAAMAIVAPAQAQEPLSAIDWLSRSVRAAPFGAVLQREPGLTEAPVSNGVVAAEPIMVAPLVNGGPQAPGLIAAGRSGLPAGLWGATPEAELAALLRRESIDTLPAVQALLRLLLVAELDPPLLRSGGADSLLLARVDRLLDLGALEPAFALLQIAGAGAPEHFRRLFDIALLLGEEDRACRILRATPSVSPSYPAHIYCLARSGDWPSATLVFASARALDELTPAMSDLLERFLDPGFADGLADLPAPVRPTPLAFRLMEAIGQAQPTGNLPLAFAQADLRANIGWKARIEAAERLARMGSLEPNQLLGLYTERSAAASGGVWARVDAMARLDAALTARDAAAVAHALPEVQRLMQAAGLESHLAALFARPLGSLPLTGEADRLAFRLAMLAPEFEAAARARRPRDAHEAFVIAVALGDTTALPAETPRAEVLKSVFDLPAGAVGEPYAKLLADDRQGEGLLLAIAALSDGARGDLRAVGPALTLLRQLGLESTARRAALELLLMEPRA